MNWSRAKTILIIAFVITDIFLLFIYFKPGIKSEEFNDNKALAEFLAQKGIYVDEKTIPRGQYDLAVLYVHGEDESCGAFDLLLSPGKGRWKAEGDGDKDYQQAADAFIKEAGGAFVTAVFDGIIRDEGYVKAVYKNVINGITIETSNVIVIFRDGTIVDYDCDWLEIKGFHENSQKTISAAQALLLFMALNEDGAEAYIDSIEMVYWLDETVQIDLPVSEDTAFPMWKITYNGGDHRHIDAFEHN